MSTLLSRLQFNPTLAGDQLKDNNPAVNKQLESMPSVLPEWAKTDMKNNSVGGYYSNPVVTVTQTLVTYCNNIMGVEGITQVGQGVGIFNAANTFVHATPAYIAHTNRISGVTPINQNTMSLPHLDTAINQGKILTTLLYQTDGVQNNAPMIGCFSGLYTVNAFSNTANTIITYAGEIRNSINVTTTTDEQGNTYTTYTSNLLWSRANTMASVINNLTNEMSTRRLADETFFTNGQQIILEYGSLKKFNRLGATETNMFNNLVGSDKLKTRLNS